VRLRLSGGGSEGRGSAGSGREVGGGEGGGGEGGGGEGGGSAGGGAQGARGATGRPRRAASSAERYAAAPPPETRTLTLTLTLTLTRYAAAPPPETIRQRAILVDMRDRTPLLRHLLEEEGCARAPLHSPRSQRHEYKSTRPNPGQVGALPRLRLEPEVG